MEIVILVITQMENSTAKVSTFGLMALFTQVHFVKDTDRVWANGNQDHKTMNFTLVNSLGTRNKEQESTYGVTNAYTKEIFSMISSKNILKQTRNRQSSLSRRKIHGGCVDSGSFNRSFKQSYISQSRITFRITKDKNIEIKDLNKGC